MFKRKNAQLSVVIAVVLIVIVLIIAAIAITFLITKPSLIGSPYEDDYSDFEEEYEDIEIYGDPISEGLVMRKVMAIAAIIRTMTIRTTAMTTDSCAFFLLNMGVIMRCSI